MLYLGMLDGKGQKPVLAYTQYGGNELEPSMLYLCANRKQFSEMTHKVLSGKNMRFVAKSLPEDSHAKGFFIEGRWANIFGKLVTNFRSVFDGEIDSSVSHLCGFFEPTKEDPNDAAILWLDEENEYKMAIVYSKNQARQIIESFDWMDFDEMDQWLENIKSWKTMKSSLKPVYFSGPCARVLCLVSLEYNLSVQERRGAH